MQNHHRKPELSIITALQQRQARVLRGPLISGWLVLITSLLITTSPVPGNRIFWGTVVPTGLLVIAALSHELWGCNAAGPARGIGRNWC